MFIKTDSGRFPIYLSSRGIVGCITVCTEMIPVPQWKI